MRLKILNSYFFTAKLMAKYCQKPVLSLRDIGYIMIGAGTGFVALDCLWNGDRNCIVNLINMFIPKLR